MTATATTWTTLLFVGVISLGMVILRKRKKKILKSKVIDIGRHFSIDAGGRCS